MPLLHQVVTKKLWDKRVGQEEEAGVDPGWVVRWLHSSITVTHLTFIVPAVIGLNEVTQCPYLIHIMSHSFTHYLFLYSLQLMFCLFLCTFCWSDVIIWATGSYDVMSQCKYICPTEQIFFLNLVPQKLSRLI